MKTITQYTYRPQGVCASNMQVALDNEGIIQNIQIMHGCDGNAQGLIALCIGKNASEVINRLEGISCSGRATSCPDQLARALQLALAAAE